MLAACSMAQLGNSLALPCILRRLDCNVSSGSASQQIAFLCDVIEFSEQDARAAAAVAALQLIGGEQVVPVIESLLRNRQHLLLRYLCSLALERLNTPGAIASLISIIDDCQYDIFSDPTFPVSALSNIKCVEAVPALVIMANSHHDSGRQCSAIHALGQIGGAEAETAVRNALEAQASSVRDAALTALGALKNPDYIPILASFLKKRDHLNSRHAIDAIWKIGGERALEALYDRILEYSTHPNLL
jgi:HEAT repeat protein